MMNWFYKWLGNKIDDSKQNEDVEETGAIPMIARPRGNKRNRAIAGSDVETLTTDPIILKMFKASGGWAIEFRQYDSKKDVVDTTLYVVNSEEELGNNISKIITMEALKR